MMVKICGITRREDAEAAVAAGASALGFIFFPPSPRYIAPERAAEIANGLPIAKVGVFVNESAASIEAVMRAANLDVAQIYGGEAPTRTRVWKAFRVSGSFDPALAEGAEAVLLDGPANGVGFDWALASDVARALVPAASALVPTLRGATTGVETSLDAAGTSARATSSPRVIVAGGLDASNVAEAIRVAQPWGVDASSRLETSPGVKDHEKVRQFIAAALRAQ